MLNTIKILTATLLLSTAACGGNAADDLGKLKDEACACKTKECAEAVNKKMDDKLKNMKESDVKDEATAKKLFEVMAEAGKCIAKHGVKASDD